MKFLSTMDWGKTLKALFLWGGGGEADGGRWVKLKGSGVKMALNSLKEILEAMWWCNAFKILKKNYSQPEILYLATNNKDKN